MAPHRDLPPLFELAVHDVQGRTVAVLAQGERDPGAYSVSWSGQGAGGPVAAGIYFLRYETPGRTFTRRVAIAR